ncbi:hypothetical protein Raf01_62980 [Rugosimonospora africana]|uniref:DUF885 domain-containing protein n=2 Tax=Rugosimonospora africana TaxID=556532 RepID=A0A8J3R0T1_9ACTN|nr:hypothetical protein Raf01_62980 [Rugosimonospora africana]
METGRDGDSATGLADEMIKLMFAAEPLGATLLGVPGYDELLSDPSEEAEQELRAKGLALGQRADRLAESTVDEGDAVTLAVVAQQARAQADRIDARAVEYTISDFFAAPASGLLSVLPMLTFPDAQRAEAFLARLRAVPEFLDGVVSRHRAGLAAGRTPVAHLVRGAIAHLDRYLADPANDPLLRQPGPEDYPTFAQDRERVVAEVVRPALAAYRDVLAAEFSAAGRPEEKSGICWLPDGEAMYAGLSRAHTSTERSPEELHQTGLDLIAKLAEEYREVGSRVFGVTDLADIFERMRTDPALRWQDGDELLDAARSAIERAEAAAPAWFGRMPSTRCQVEAVPAAEAPGQPAAYYMMPSLDGKRPGVYFANTYQAHERGRQTSEATAFHEAVPGHHFQQAISLELTDLPLLRRCADVNAYSEGWGLYCERLADEMGLYSGDVDRLGMLTLDSMRAGRLVVDTGLHIKGWSRQQAIDYLMANTPMAPVEIVAEVDRYIAAPGQALSYMVGRLEILRIRAEATRALGDRFDIKAFHDVVLGGGPLPLSVLDEVVTRWARASA